jgi:hypothetical protein
MRPRLNERRPAQEAMETKDFGAKGPEDER